MLRKRDYFYLGDNKALTILKTGENFIIDTESLDLAVSIISVGFWEPWIERHLIKIAKQGANIIDAGANVGYYSVRLGNKIGPTGRLFAFEPHPKTYFFLKNNLYINGLTHCTAENVGLSNTGSHDDEMWFMPHQKAGGFVTRDKETDLSDRGFQKANITLQQLDDSVPKEMKFDLIKIDVEGFEPNVLYGAQNVLERSPDLHLAVELSPSGWEGQGNDPMDVFDYLKDLGFSFRLATSDNKLQPITPIEMIEAAGTLESAGTLGYVTSFFASRVY